MPARTQITKLFGSGSTVVDVEPYLSKARVEMAPTSRADVTLWLPEAEARAQLADQLAECSLQAEREERCRWVSPLDTLSWLTLWILRLECTFDVHGPAELINHLCDVGARVVRSVPSMSSRISVSTAGLVT